MSGAAAGRAAPALAALAALHLLAPRPAAAQSSPGAPGALHVEAAQTDRTARIGEIRVHGNHTTPDAEIVALSGLAAGEAATDERLAAAAQALHGSGRFDAVDVRRRQRSIDDPADVLVILLVDELDAIRDDVPTPGVLRRLRAGTQWMPILDYTDGYGPTYGVRLRLATAAGRRSRVSVPLTWGGERRASLEFERPFTRGPLSLVRAGGGISQRENPHFDLADRRTGLRVEAERALRSWLRAGASGRTARVDFGPDYQAQHTAGGLHLAADTRTDPSFPRNAVYARLAWERLDFGTGHAGRWLTDTRAYLAAGGATVVLLRAQAATSSAPLPDAEQALLGGFDSLRGYRAGHRAGDNLAAATLELRVPFTSPLRVARFGAKAFVDVGTTWAAGARLTDQRFARGAGAGIFLGAATVMLEGDVAWPEDGRPRVHVGLTLGL